MKKISVAFILTIYVQIAFAQKTVFIHTDNILDSLIEADKNTAPGMDGFRVQIYFGSERKAAQEIRGKFLQLFPNTEAYLIYQQPYFKVRTGDYRTRFEAYAAYKKIIPNFDKVFIVPDRINFPSLITQP